MKIVAIFLTFCFLSTLVYGHLSPIVKLPTTKNDYLCVIVGIPGKNMCFFIDHECNETIILYEEPTFTSQTYTVYPSTVLLHLGVHAFRFGAVFDASLRDPTPYFDNEDGRICFGVMSQVWNHWTKATFSPDFIVLGNYDVSLTRDTYRTFEIQFDKVYPTNVTVADAQYYLWYDSSTIYTFLPDNLFFNMSLLDLVFGNDHHVHVGIDDVDISVQNPLSMFRHNTIRRHGTNDTIIFGRAFTKNFVIFYDAITQTRWVRPAFDFFNYGLGRDVWVYSVGVVCNLYILFWLGKVLLRANKKLSSLSFSALEMLIYVVSLVVLYVEVFGYATQRFVSFYTETSTVILYTSLIVFIQFNTLIGIILAAIYWRTSHLLGVRRIPVETTAFLLLWLTQIHHVDEGIDNVFLLFVSSLYATLRFMQLALTYINGNMQAFGLSAIYSVFSVLFFVCFNARPLIGLYFHDDVDQISTILMMFIAMVCLPAIYMVFYIMLTEFRRETLAVSKRQ